MKQFIIILAMTWGLGLQAQKKEIRLYAFRQELSQGSRNASINEKGETKTDKRTASINNLIYLEIPKGDKISITELWIKGKKYQFDTVAQKGPIVLNTGLNMPGQQNRILVPAGTGKIIKISPKESKDITATDKRKLAGHNEVVVYYIHKGKPGHKMLSKMEEVEKMVMQ